MTSRVTFVSPATSPSLRQARFYDGDSIDDIGAARAREAAGSLPVAARVVVSPVCAVGRRRLLSASTAWTHGSWADWTWAAGEAARWRRWRLPSRKPWPAGSPTRGAHHTGVSP